MIVQKPQIMAEQMRTRDALAIAPNADPQASSASMLRPLEAPKRHARAGASSGAIVSGNMNNPSVLMITRTVNGCQFVTVLAVKNGCSPALQSVQLP